MRHRIYRRIDGRVVRNAAQIFSVEKGRARKKRRRRYVSLRLLHAIGQNRVRRHLAARARGRGDMDHGKHVFRRGAAQRKHVLRIAFCEARDDLCRIHRRTAARRDDEIRAEPPGCRTAFAHIFRRGIGHDPIENAIFYTGFFKRRRNICQRAVFCGTFSRYDDRPFAERGYVIRVFNQAIAPAKYPDGHIIIKIHVSASA